MPKRTQFWESLYAAVRSYKADLPDDAPAKERGFSILYNPPAPGRLLVMGLNPRRIDSTYAQQHPDTEQGPPTEHLYATERGGTLGKRMQRLVSDAGFSEERAEAVWDAVLRGNKTNLWFFGSRGAGEWRSSDFWGSGGRALRRKIERQCLQWQELIIRELQPPALLFEGMSAYDQMRKVSNSTFFGHLSVPRERSSARLLSYATATIDNEAVPVLAIIHPTGARGITAGERACMGQALVDFFSQTGVIDDAN